MVAAVLLVTGVLATLTMMDGANKRITENRAREAGTNLAREIAEAARAVPYPDVTRDSLETVLQMQPGLGDASSDLPGWQLIRRNVTYTVTTDTCVIDDDDPRDGLGDHSAIGADSFCPDSQATGTADVNPDDYRRVTIQLDQVDANKPLTVRQSAVINNPGSAFAPSVRTLVPTSPAGMTTPYRVTSTATTSMSFTARVTPRAQMVEWYIDNLKQPTNAVQGTGSATDDWSFTWPVPSSVVDGIYVIGAQGFKNGQSGTTKAVTVTLNRFRPARPTDLAGGRDDGWVEFEWSPVADRDVLEYRVYRATGSVPHPPSSSPSQPTTDQLVCSKAVTNPIPHSCRATDTYPSTGNYYVVAYAPACCGAPISSREESLRPTMAQTLVVNNSNSPPHNVRNLTGTRTTVGGAPVVTLNWNEPASPAAGESSDTLRYYRIYRDGIDNSDRYAVVPATELTWTDTNPGFATRRYYVVAVDSKLADSGAVGISL